MENLRCEKCGRFTHYYGGQAVIHCPKCNSCDLEELEGKWNSDLSMVRIGDLIATTREGWIKVWKISGSDYPISASHSTYTLDGRHRKEDVSPSAFIVPPAYLLDIIGPKPEEIECAICGKKLVYSEDEIFNIDDITMCASCSRTVKKYHEVKNCSQEKPSESSKVVGYDDNGVPLHVDDDVLVWDFSKKDAIKRKYARRLDDSSYSHGCYMDGCDSHSSGGEWPSNKNVAHWRHAVKVEE